MIRPLSIPTALLLVLAPCVVCSENAPAGEKEVPRIPLSLSLGEAFRLATAHSPAIATARARIHEQSGVELIARAAFLPTLDGRANYSARDTGLVESFGPGVVPNQKSWATDVVITYDIYDGGVRRASLAASRDSLRAAEQSLRAVVHDTLYEVAVAYYDALLARDGISVQQEALDVLGEQLQTADRRFQAGTAEKFSVLQAQVALANARPALVSARAAYRLAIDRLRAAAGLSYPPGADPADVRLTDGWPPVAADENLETALMTAALLRPELAAADALSAAARRELEAEIARTRSTVTAAGGYGLQGRSFGSSTLDDPLHGWTGGIEWRIPLFDPGQARGRRMLAEARIEVADAENHDKTLRVEAEVRAAWLELEEAREIIASSELVVQQADEALRLARAAFDAGTGTQLDVLESRLALTRASLTRLEAARQLHQATAALRRASGQTP